LKRKHLNRVTDQSFYKYLKCPSWLSHERDLGDDREALRRTLQDEGLLPEKEKALLEGRDYQVVDLDDLDEAAQRTLELMKEGVETIYKGTLIHGNWVGRPDLLERVEGDSDLGTWYYIACDIKRSSRLKDDYKFQGSFYADILERLQGVRPVQGYVLHSDGHISGYLLEPFETEYALTLDRIESILEGHNEAHFLTSSCKQSPWFHKCTEGAKGCDDLSLINRIWRSEVKALEAVGIDSVEALSKASKDTLRSVTGVTEDRLLFLQQQAIALKEGEIMKLSPVALPTDDDDLALVVDIESDPLRDVDYLFGVLVVKDGKEKYKAFTAEKPEDEEEIWHAFTAFLETFPETVRMYHYGWYEQDVFRKKVEMYGAPEKVKALFNQRMVDVLPPMREAVIFPTPFYSLKDIAKQLGFKWRIPDASGLDSILWYHEWIEKGDKSALNDILEYNEDDVRATWLVRNWALGKL
jgi:uncharacterized protein